MPHWRVAGLLVALTAGVVVLGGCGGQSSSRLLPGGPVPPCSAPTDTPSITLSGSIPSPTVTVVQGSRLVVIVPGAHDVNETNVTATNVTFDQSVMTAECSTVLRNRGRRTVLLARHVGKSTLFATISAVVGDVNMPALSGTVVVNP
jgi:hypothetical protein